MSEAKYEAIQEQVHHLLTLGVTFNTTLSSKQMQANQMQDKARTVEHRLAKLCLACISIHPPAELQDKIHSALGDITTRLSNLHGISCTAADLLTNEVDNSLNKIGNYLDTPSPPAVGMQIHHQLVKQLRGYTDLLDHFQVPPAPNPAAPDKQPEDITKEKNLTTRTA